MPIGISFTLFVANNVSKHFVAQKMLTCLVLFSKKYY